MRHFYLLFFCSAILLTSCNQVDTMTISKAEEHVTGTWTMKRVRNSVKKDGKWGKNDVSNNYANWTFNFNSDYSMSLYIPEEDLTLEGYWEIYEDYETDSDGDESTVNNLYMFVYDPNDWYVEREFIWEDMRITSSTFEAEETRLINGQEHRYFYELSK